MSPSGNPANKLDTSIVWLGRAISWCVPVMALLVLVIVVLRYGFNTGAIAAQESVQYLHAAIFMLGRPSRLALISMCASTFSTGLYTPATGMGQRTGPHHFHTADLRSHWMGVLGLRCGQLVSEGASLNRADCRLSICSRG